MHSLLRHLEEVGFEGAPRVLGFDDQNREVLTHLPSEPAARWSDEALIGAAQLVRRLHDALADFVPPPGAVWRCPSIGRRAPDGPIGHNDLQPANTVYAGGLPYGFIDWDRPAPPLPSTTWHRRPSHSRHYTTASTSGRPDAPRRPSGSPGCRCSATRTASSALPSSMR